MLNSSNLSGLLSIAILNFLVNRIIKTYVIIEYVSGNRMYYFFSLVVSHYLFDFAWYHI